MRPWAAFSGAGRGQMGRLHLAEETARPGERRAGEEAVAPGGEEAQGAEGLSLSLSPPRVSCCPRAADPMKRWGSHGSGQRCPGVCGPSKRTLTSSMPAGPKGSTRPGSLGGPAWGQLLPKCEEGLGPAGCPGDWTQQDRHSCLFRGDRGNVAHATTHLLRDLWPAGPC